jgi:adenylate cyclase
MASIFKKLHKKPLIISMVIILIGILAYRQNFAFLDFVEKKTIDLRFRTRGNIPTGSNIVLAVIDEKSIDREGKWPWPRSKIADLVTILSNAGAKVIAFDIVFDEPDRSGILKAIDGIENKASSLGIKNKALQIYLKTLRSQSDNDRLLADAIKKSRAKVVLGYFFQMASDVKEQYDEKKVIAQKENCRGSRYKSVRYSSKDAKSIPLKEAIIPEPNIEGVSNSTDYSGFFNMSPDTDGVIRWAPAIIKFENDLYAPLSIKAVQAYLDATLSIKIEEFGVGKIDIGDFSVPTDIQGQILVNYRGDSRRFPHIPITDILNNKVPDDIFKDKIVIVGATATGIYDMRATPFSGVFPGVEIHANLIDSILSKDFLYKPDWVQLFYILAIILAGLFLGLVLPNTGAVSGTASVILIFVGYIVLCQYLFSSMGWVLNLVYPLFVTVMVYVVITAHRYIIEESQKRFIKKAFSKYLAPTMVNQLVESPEKLNLGGEKREITAFFSDIQGFTSISEKLLPNETSDLLNEFLTEMADIILKHEGTVDKFEGDAIIAFFGAPNNMGDHAERACMASIEMQKRLAVLREKWRKAGKPRLKMRIGLSSGPAVVGNMGSKDRFDYTMIGDTVNTAARLEGANKAYGIYTLVSESTYSKMGQDIIAREIDTINVVGKDKPIAIYQLLDFKEDIDERLYRTTYNYDKGLKSYRNQEWDKAINFFEAALEITPDDGPSITMIERCMDFRNSPPAKKWDGSFSLSFK